MTHVRMNALLAVPLVAALLGGCLADETGAPLTLEAAADLTIRIPEGTWDASHTGQWYDPETIDEGGPLTIRLINDDHVMHRIIALPWTPPLRPSWLSANDNPQTGADDHDDHHHGGSGHGHGAEPMSNEEGQAPSHHGHNGTGFDVTLGPGDSEVITVPAGSYAIHCHPHPWMTGMWIVGKDSPTSYPVVVHEMTATGQATGEGSTGDSTTYRMKLMDPNLVALTATITWQDGDGLHPALNAPDRIKVELLDQQENVVDSQELDATVGTASVAVNRTLGWPNQVDADSWYQADADLRAAYPANHAWVGEWGIRVTLVAAPGVLPDAIPVADPSDGNQEWTVHVTAKHEWASTRLEPSTSTVTRGSLA